MRILAMLIMLSVIAVSCSYRVTTINNYNCCPQMATWVDTVGMVGTYNVHVVGTRKDVNYVFSQSTITNIKGFHIVEVIGSTYTIEVRNPHF